MAPATNLSSQEVIDKFWETSIASSNPPTKASATLPQNVYAQRVQRLVPKGLTETECSTKSYEESVKTCQTKVAQIVRNCKQINQKYSDPYFDLENHLHCIWPLYGRTVPTGMAKPLCVKRIGDIFDNPSFYVDGVNANDIKQGSGGDCWFLAALAALCSMEPAETLVERVCVARDEEVGVYGFVFYRDGEWTSVIVDDKLYMRKPDYEYLEEKERFQWEDNRVRVNSAEEYRKEFQSNSRALYYAQSSHPDETWVPLIEKAFAKAHGDYTAIDGGEVHEAIEDMTGGVGTTVKSADILCKNKFWEDLLKVNQEFIFGCATQAWDDPYQNGRDGMIANHAYSILKAKNYAKDRLLLIKNPWGKREWNGPWSDGSSQWTVDSLKELGHTFGDDGIFWIRYEDFLRKYSTIWRTRLFGPEWNVTQQWTTLAIPWAGYYQDTKFELVLPKAAPTVIVLSQLDSRYFNGFEGQYSIRLSLRLHKNGEPEYIARTSGECEGQRSVNVELHLEAGTYEVRLKISASRDDNAEKIEDVVQCSWLDRRQKLLTIGLSYDLAHAKGQLKKPDKHATEVSTAEETPVPTTAAAAAAAPSAQPTSAAATVEEAEPIVWGADCVVGLRVYCKNADATVQLVRPKEEVPEKLKLDIDDPAKDASKDTEVVNTPTKESQVGGEGNKEVGVKDSKEDNGSGKKEAVGGEKKGNAVGEKKEVEVEDTKKDSMGEKKADSVGEKEDAEVEGKEAAAGEKKDAGGEEIKEPAPKENDTPTVGMKEAPKLEEKKDTGVRVDDKDDAKKDVVTNPC